MLVLSRRVSEQVIIDGAIVLTVVAIKGDRVRIGISAPSHVRIDRHEVHQRRDEFATDCPNRHPPSGVFPAEFPSQTDQPIKGFVA